MRLSYQGLRLLLHDYLVELTFMRKRPKLNYPPHRRILCTNNAMLLNSIPGKITLKFHQPTKHLSYDPRRYFIVPVWDIFWQDYRMINVKDHDIVGMMPLKSEEDIQKFWMFFNDLLNTMSAQDKIKFTKSQLAMPPLKERK